MSWQGVCRNGEISGSQDAVGIKTLESAVTTGDNPQWLSQSSAWLRGRWGKGKRQTDKKKEREKEQGRTGERSERKEEESKREGDVHQIVPITHVSPAISVTIPD